MWKGFLFPTLGMKFYVLCFVGSEIFAGLFLPWITFPFGLILPGVGDVLESWIGELFFNISLISSPGPKSWVCWRGFNFLLLVQKSYSRLMIEFVLFFIHIRMCSIDINIYMCVCLFVFVFVFHNNLKGHLYLEKLYIFFQLVFLPNTDSSDQIWVITSEKCWLNTKNLNPVWFVSGVLLYSSCLRDFSAVSFVILCREKRWIEMKLSLTDQLTMLRLQTHPAPLWKKIVDSKYSWMRICSWSTISCVLLECRLNLCSWDALDTNSNMSCSWVLDILIPDHLKYRFVFLF